MHHRSMSVMVPQAGPALSLTGSVTDSRVADSMHRLMTTATADTCAAFTS